MRKNSYYLALGDQEWFFEAETFEEAVIKATEVLGPEWPLEVIVKNLERLDDWGGGYEDKDLEMDLDEADSRS